MQGRRSKASAVVPLRTHAKVNRRLPNRVLPASIHAPVGPHARHRPKTAGTEPGGMPSAPRRSKRKPAPVCRRFHEWGRRRARWPPRSSSTLSHVSLHLLAVGPVRFDRSAATDPPDIFSLTLQPQIVAAKRMDRGHCDTRTPLDSHHQSRVTIRSRFVYTLAWVRSCPDVPFRHSLKPQPL